VRNGAGVYKGKIGIEIERKKVAKGRIKRGRRERRGTDCRDIGKGGIRAGEASEQGR